MCERRLLSGTIVALLVLWSVTVAPADITSLSGSVAATVHEFRVGGQGNVDQASDSYPGTSELPLQVVARLISESPDEAAGMAAAQFADPTELNQPNPEEFAINLTLDSISANIRYTGEATSQEMRTVLFGEAELGQPAGTSVALVGRLFLDGVLVVFSVAPDRDLTGAYVCLRVTVVQQVTGQEDQTVFSGSVELSGGPGGTSTTASSGQFPTASLILTDLSVLPDSYGVLYMLVLPDLAIDYDYQATVGEAFTLQATVEVEAGNLADGVGVVALLGTPTDTFEEVVTLTQGQAAAAKLLSTIEKERDEPSGQLAFPDQSTFAPPLFGLCGTFGLEAAVGLFALFGLKFAGRRWSGLRG
jgi:hypothetical protein